MSANAYGDHVRIIRQSNGMSLREVAERLGVSHVYLSEVERGTRCPMVQEKTIRLAGIIGTDVDRLIALAASVRGFTFDVRPDASRVQIKLLLSFNAAWDKLTDQDCEKLLSIVEKRRGSVKP
jgi:transcriptional regulator with XRE-family HTH domain